jgi:diguanylate cyclase (GGDEF)-like protein
VIAVVARPDGGAWFGLQFGGIEAYRPGIGRIGTLPVSPGRPPGENPEFAALVADRSGGALLAAEDGLWRIAPDGRSKQRVGPGSREAIAILETRDAVWVATADDGLQQTDPATGRTRAYRHDAADPASLASSSVKALLEAGDGRLWAGTSEGLDLFDPATGRARHFVHDPADRGSLPGGDVWTLLRDRRGRIWAGTGGGGIGVLEGIPPEDAAARFRHIGRAEGLPHDNVEAMLEDPAGRIWAATDDGIAAIDPDRLAVLRRMEPADGQAITYYWENAGARLADGTMLFGGEGGVSIVHPDRLRAWSYVPPVRVSEVTIDGRRQPAAAPIALGPGARRLEVAFSALDYSAPEQNRYAYRLDGYDADWVAAGAQRRVAVYENLPPGRYTLLLRGSNRAGLWADPPTTLAVAVLPAWYQTIWARIAEGAAAVALVVLVVQLRTRHLRRRRAQLEREVALRTKELADINLALGHSAETLQAANAELERLASHDPLTGLANRRRFFEAAAERLAQARRHGRAASVLMADLDHFKRINDAHGHAGGDAALKAAARCLADSLREIDVVARYGGEELVAFLTETDLADALVVAERFRATLEAERIRHMGAEIRVTASIGVAAWHPEEPGIEPALARADAALYRVKQATRNAVAAEPPPERVGG